MPDNGIRDEFSVHRLNHTGFVKVERIAAIFSQALSALDEIVMTGRERSLVVTKLQEACFFAKRAIAVDTTNQTKTVGAPLAP